MVDNKRSNRHSNPSKAKGMKRRHVFFRKKNRQVRQLLKVFA